MGKKPIPRKMPPEELRAYLEFRRRGKRHKDRRAPKGGGRSYISRSWEE